MPAPHIQVHQVVGFNFNLGNRDDKLSQETKESVKNDIYASYGLGMDVKPEIDSISIEVVPGLDGKDASGHIAIEMRASTIVREVEEELMETVKGSLTAIGQSKNLQKSEMRAEKVRVMPTDFASSK